jgi:hypothetical protein
MNGMNKMKNNPAEGLVKDPRRDGFASAEQRRRGFWICRGQ